MLKNARVVLLALLVGAVALTGCSSEKPTEPKYNGPDDPKIKRAGQSTGGATKSGPAPAAAPLEKN